MPCYRCYNTNIASVSKSTSCSLDLPPLYEIACTQPHCVCAIFIVKNKARRKRKRVMTCYMHWL